MITNQVETFKPVDIAQIQNNQVQPGIETISNELNIESQLILPVTEINQPDIDDPNILHHKNQFEDWLKTKYDDGLK